MMRTLVYEHLSAMAEVEVDGELLAAGLAMRDAVVGDLLASGDCAVSVAIGCDAAAAAPAGARPERVLPRTCGLDFVARQAVRHDRVWVIAPETGGVLGQLQRAVGDARWLGCTARAIESTSSKCTTLAQVAGHGVLTPLAFSASPDTRRWVVKPDDGAGAVATRVHASLAAARGDAAARQRQGQSATLEAWVDGEPLSLSLLCSQGKIELLSVNRQQLSIDADGALSFTGVQIDALRRDDGRVATLRSWARVLGIAVPGLRGYVGVDLTWHRQLGPVLIEINPRVTMAYVGLSAALGRNLARAVLAAHLQERADATA